ncbi:MAG TPA: DUF2490 domain-containing protein [Catalimonadaceae bacterium]|nr:DUF2490 domain-containing protein [Catalimonadaceae bacterium]HPI10879.1 DUF2490 domain-containing protein [Catalimonadaceae bacterium]
MKQARLFAVLFHLFFLQVSAQPADLGSWSVFNLKYNHSERWSLFGEAQLRSLRFYHHFHYYEYKAGINYHPVKTVRFTIGAGHYQTFKEGGDFVLPKNSNEFRLWPQVSFLQEIGKLAVEQRYRVEMRWISGKYRNRFRYRVGFSVPFGKDTKGFKPFQASLSNELFFTDQEPYFERNRLQLALNFKPSRNATIQLGYLHQFDYKINDETGRDFLVAGFFYELFRNSSSRTESEKELKDY